MAPLPYVAADLIRPAQGHPPVLPGQKLAEFLPLLIQAAVHQEHLADNPLLAAHERQGVDLLTKIKGITARKAQEIGESYRYQTGMRRLLDFLSLNDLPLSLALRLYRRYGGEALEAVRENPYLLVDELYGVDFAVMDEIALSMGMAGDSRRR